MATIKSIEEKAKAYDMALENAKHYHSEMGDDICCILEECFPELKESEDEMIRKTIFKALSKKDARDVLLANGVQVSDALSWLEAQVEHANFRNKIQIGDNVTRNEDGVLVNLSQLKRIAKKDDKQGEQNPAWSKEDEYLYTRIIRRYKDYEGLIIRTKEESIANKMLDAMTQEEIWLKSLKARIQPKRVKPKVK